MSRNRRRVLDAWRVSRRIAILRRRLAFTKVTRELVTDERRRPHKRRG